MLHNYAVKLSIYFCLSPILFCACNGYCDSPVLDQSFTGPMNGGSGFNGNWGEFAQTFTVGKAGILSDLKVNVIPQSYVGRSGTLVVSVCDIVNGIPNDVLGSVSFPESSFPRGVWTWIDADVTPFNIFVAPGQQYAIKLYASGTNGYEWAAHSGQNGYTRGKQCELTYSSGVWTTNSTWDNLFETYVQPIPEPSTLALLGMGGIGLIAYGWRRRKAHRIVVCFIALMASTAGMARADVFNMGGTRNPTTGTWTGQASLEFVTVGNINNPPDTRVMNDGTTGYGSVGYNYKIGKYEVTAGQYTQFLNAVAGNTDPYHLYDSMNMGYTPYGSSIYKNGSVYTATLPNEPMNYISWGDAARFCNWLQNGQPTGAEGNGTTETGAYTLNGHTDDSYLLKVKRNAGATFFIPTENEWYKAAYYKGGGTNAGYWLYPTKSDTAPINTLPDTGNHANFRDYYGTGNHGYTDTSHYLTAVGAFSASPSAYGTFDQGGNISEMNEGVVSDFSSRGQRGGMFDSNVDFLAADSRWGINPPSEFFDLGFRVASVPEPGSLAMLLSIAVGGLLWWRRKR